MGSVSASRRVSAIVALVAGISAIAVAVAELIHRPQVMLGSVACLGVAIGAASYAITRSGPRRSTAAVVAIAAALTPIVLLVVYGVAISALLFVLFEAIAAGTARHALGRDIAQLKAGPTPGLEVGAAVRPVLIMNPKSGGGKVERFHLEDEARRRGIEPIVLRSGNDLTHLAEEAVGARGADVIGMAGGDGSQALVASVAMRHGVAFVCVPAGTRNHLAMDLGLDRNDVVGALEAFGPAVERRIDLAFMGDRVFVNNATMGLYAKIVQSPEYRDQKARTALDMLPAMLGPDARPLDLRYTGPDGTEVPSAHLILVSNDPYELSHREGFGSRRRIDGGTLGIVAATFRNAQDIARFVQLQSAGQARRFRGWLEWTDTRFEVRSNDPIEVGLDGEALVMDPPVTFRSVPGALRVRIPPHAPGYSPAASSPRPGWSTIKALIGTAGGRPVSIEG